MSSPKTKAEARERIAELQGRIAQRKVDVAHYKSVTPKSSCRDACISRMNHEIASMKAEIAKLRAKIPSLS